MVEKLYIKATEQTPEILADPELGEISISGFASLHHSLEFFQPLFKWIEDYYKDPRELTRYNFRMTYMSNSANLCILDMFRMINSTYFNNKIEIYWYYQIDDEDMEEEGEDFREIVKVPFNLIEEQ